MKRNDNLPVVGDKIVSAKFAFGFYDNEKRESVTVDGVTKSRPVGYFLSEEERLDEAAKTGKIPNKKKTVELGAYDFSRASAVLVVEIARMQGGGSDSRPGDDYPDGWYVQARRLNKDESYDSNGEVIQFYMSGCFINMIKAEDVQIVGKMQMKFV